jgi:hypothetical protein
MGGFEPTNTREKSIQAGVRTHERTQGNNYKIWMGGFEPTNTREKSTSCGVRTSPNKTITLCHTLQVSPYGPMDKAPAYGAGDSGFESQYGLLFFSCGSTKARIELATFCGSTKSTQGED